ncbi:MAG TPA: energy-coupling factor transporter transmembrane component T [bacterium]|nr:energy-coupling factor transporter transmembrane component T [bacterium]HQG46131.1 energy-coupling factor transporter transmembrane component T [bacterium]HQJ64960.1 energy-coupling factor transporter transmembrane component T [bacterium]
MAFFNDITFGQYFPAASFLHRLDPRSKLAAAFCLTGGLLLTYNLYVLAGMAVLSLLVARSGGIPLPLLMKNLRPFLWLFALTWIIHIFWSDGRVLWVVPLTSLVVTREGLALGGIYVTRLALLILYAALLTLCTSPLELTDALERMTRPLKRWGVPTHELSLMLTLSLRFIPTLLEEAQRIRNAQLSRGARFNGSLRHRIRSLLPLLVPLFVSAFHRADELASAMDARCYTGGEGRTVYTRLHFAWTDYLVMTGSLLFFTLCIWL